MCSQASLWSWLYAEATQISFWCVNQILLPQTWCNGHFLRFKRHFEVFCLLGALKLCLSDHHLRSCGPRKMFCGSRWHQTCILALLHDHTYAQKQTESVLDASMWWYDSKRELMAIFWISYPLKGVYKGNCIEIEQKLCFGDLLLYLCGPWKFFLRITST